jgi:hypothetical protein
MLNFLSAVTEGPMSPHSFKLQLVSLLCVCFFFCLFLNLVLAESPSVERLSRCFKHRFISGCCTKYVCNQSLFKIREEGGKSQTPRTKNTMCATQIFNQSLIQDIFELGSFQVPLPSPLITLEYYHMII